jgi:hypothetical protein
MCGIVVFLHELFKFFWECVWTWNFCSWNELQIVGHELFLEILLMCALDIFVLEISFLNFSVMYAWIIISILCAPTSHKRNLIACNDGCWKHAKLHSDDGLKGCEDLLNNWSFKKVIKCMWVQKTQRPSLAIEVLKQW